MAAGDGAGERNRYHREQCGSQPLVNPPAKDRKKDERGGGSPRAEGMRK